jgi:hypothetical protein
MISGDDFSQINALDFEAIKERLIHRKKGGEGWSLERANAAEREYRRFLYLAKKFPNERTAPIVDVDTFWHHHILDTRKYADDCQRVFGYLLHHFPYAGMRGKDDEIALTRMGERMRVIYEDTFGDAYPGSVQVGGNQAQTAMSSAIRLAAVFGASPTSRPTPADGTPERRAHAAELAYCFVTNDHAEGAGAATSFTSELAYCFVTNHAEGAEAATAVRTSQSAELAYCFVANEPAPSPAAVSTTEARLGYYLERPRLS